MVEETFGFLQTGVVDEFGGGEEGGGVAFADGELGVEDEGEGGDFFDGWWGWGWGGHGVAVAVVAGVLVVLVLVGVGIGLIGIEF